MKRVCRYVDGQWVWDPPFSAAEDRRASERFEDMVRSGQGPALMTDAVFLAGMGCNGSQFEGGTASQLGDRFKANAESEGVSVKGKVYLSGLAAYPGDPRAWVSDRHDVQKVCEERNFSVTGAVTHKAEDRPEPKLLPDG